MSSTSRVPELEALFEEPDRIERDRVCRICRVLKPATAFHRNRRQRFGRHHVCAPCRSANREDRTETPEAGLRRKLLKHYGITLEQYRMLLDEQGGVCAICRKPPTGKQHRLAVDHCHTSRRVRALLCMRCNTMLGVFEGFRDQAALYLERFGEGSPLIDHELAAQLRRPGAA